MMNINNGMTKAIKAKRYLLPGVSLEQENMLSRF